MINGSKPSISKLCFFVFVMTIAAFTMPALAQTCDTPDDARIMAEVAAKVDADRSLSQQKKHINIFSLNGVIRLQGWTDTKGDFDNLFDIAFKAKCVKMVNVNLFSQTPPPPESPLRSSGGCASGTKACGDVCIPVGDSRSITADAPKAE
jgi:hypothetical protein